MRRKHGKAFLRALEEHRANPKTLTNGPSFAAPYDPEIENEMPPEKKTLAPSVPQVYPQPIESIPEEFKDGRYVMLHTDLHGWEIGYWSERSGSWWKKHGGKEFRYAPTHWAPLPPPPGEVAPQVCPNCEEMRRFAEIALEHEAASDDLDSAQNRVESLLASNDEPFPEDEWSRTCDARDKAAARMHQASEAYYGFDRSKLRTALSTLKSKEPQNNG